MDSLLNKKEIKKFNQMVKKMAHINEESRLMVESIMNKMNKDEINNILNTVIEVGHPKEAEDSQKLKNKYDKGEIFNVDEILLINKLYLSNENEINKKINAEQVDKNEL